MVGNIAATKLRRSFPKIQELFPARFLPPEEYEVLRVETGEKAALTRKRTYAHMRGSARFLLVIQIVNIKLMRYYMWTEGRRAVIVRGFVPLMELLMFWANCQCQSDFWRYVLNVVEYIKAEKYAEVDRRSKGGGSHSALGYGHVDEQICI